MAKSKYETHVAPKLLLIEAWARDGLILDQIAKNLGISKTTLIQYRVDHSELLNALKRGKEEADVEVENSLFKRANGYEYEEVTRELMDIVDGNRERSKQLVVTKIVTKQVAPDVTAQIFWLKNRKPNDWRDRQQIDHNVTMTLEDALDAINDG